MQVKRLWFVLLAVLTILPAANADFFQVSTTFGSQSALEDNATHLEWLHLNFTQGISYNSMQTMLQPGGQFYGWRYATTSELTQMFIDYTGSANGRVRYNDALATQFMNDLGGPLVDVTNPANGFHRESSTGMLDVPFDLGHAYYGYLAIDNFDGANIYPDRYGSSIDSFGNTSSGHWLVQAAPVVEPGTVTVLLSGFLSLGLMLRRRN